MDTVTERQISDLENLIKFYKNLGETNKHIESYVKELHTQLDELRNPKIDQSNEEQNQGQV
jgi:predicted metal-dependent peptidase